MGEEVSRIIEQNIANPSSEKYSKEYIIEKCVDIIVSEFPCMLHKKIAYNKTESIHESIPCRMYLDAENTQFK